jgi:hypothetical protein
MAKEHKDSCLFCTHQVVCLAWEQLGGNDKVDEVLPRICKAYTYKQEEG